MRNCGRTFLVCTKSTNDKIKVGEIFPAFYSGGWWKIVIINPDKNVVNCHLLDAYMDNTFTIMDWDLEDAAFREVKICQYQTN
jgi:hypothetical protein